MLPTSTSGYKFQSPCAQSSISLYYGRGDAGGYGNSAQEIEDLYPDVDVDVHSGGQPIYYYVLSVE